MSHRWPPAGPLVRRARRHSGRAALADRGRSQSPSAGRCRPDAGTSYQAARAAATAARAPNVEWGSPRSPGETARSVSPEGGPSAGADGAADAGASLLIAGPGRETILRGGFHSFSRTLEQPLGARPATRDACVTGIPREHPGELVYARAVSVERAVVTSPERSGSAPDATADAAEPSDPAPSSRPSRPPGHGR